MPTQNITSLGLPENASDLRGDADGLVARLQAGDERALGVLFEKHVPRLYHFIWRTLGDGEASDVEDLVQETMVAAMRSLNRYRGECSLYTWLCSIARHKVQDSIRRRERSRRRFAPTTLEDLTEVVCAAGSLEGEFAQQQALEQALRELPTDYRTVLVGKYIDGFTVSELARVMARSEKSVESLLTRARAALRERLPAAR